MPTLTFKVSEGEARRIRAAARRQKRSLSAHLRAELLGKKSPRAKYRSGKHPISGLPYNAAGKHLPPVSLDDIKESLADFP
jgi:hypothetical protein